MRKALDEAAYKKLWYCGSLDFEPLWQQYPPAPHYLRQAHSISRDELRHRQQERFLRQIERGWEIPFYRRHWSAVGLAPGDIRSLDDLAAIPPVFGSSSTRAHRARAPLGRLYGPRSR